MPSVKGKCVIPLVSVMRWENGARNEGKLTAVLNSLDAQKLAYVVTFDLDGDQPAVRVEYGGEVKTKPAPKHYRPCLKGPKVLPDSPLSLAVCEKRLAKALAKWNRLRGLRQFTRWRGNGKAWCEERERQQRIGHALARHLEAATAGTLTNEQMLEITGREWHPIGNEKQLDHILRCARERFYARDSFRPYTQERVLSGTTSTVQTSMK